MIAKSNLCMQPKKRFLPIAPPRNHRLPFIRINQSIYSASTHYSNTSTSGAASTAATAINPLATCLLLAPLRPSWFPDGVAGTIVIVVPLFWLVCVPEPEPEPDVSFGFEPVAVALVVVLLVVDVLETMVPAGRVRPQVLLKAAGRAETQTLMTHSTAIFWSV